MATIVFEEQLEFPLHIRSLRTFRRWATSEEFPERGRVDYIRGRIEVDMSPEDLFCHGSLKVELVGVLFQRIKRSGIGHLFSDRTRVSCSEADLSAEPDIVFVSNASLDSGRVRLVPKAGGRADRYVELEGAPDLVIEIVSDSSEQKDTQRLPVAYFEAGIPELWLADARGDELVFRIHRRSPTGYIVAPRDEEGFQTSDALGCGFRLDRARDRYGRIAFDLRVKEATP